MGTHREAAALVLLRSRANLSQSAVAGRLNMSQKAYSNRETGVTAVADDFRKRFLAALGADEADWEEAMADAKVQAPLSDHIPLYENAAAAGRYAFVQDCADTEGATMIDRGGVKHPCAFAVPVHGDSMAPTLQDGDMIICEPIMDEHDAHRLVDGRVVAVFAPDALSAEVGDIDNQSRQRKARVLPVPQGGAVGRWRWLGNGEARLEKDNAKAVPLHLPAEHVTTLRVAIVVQMRRSKL